MTGPLLSEDFPRSKMKRGPVLFCQTHTPESFLLCRFLLRRARADIVACVFAKLDSDVCCLSKDCRVRDLRGKSLVLCCVSAVMICFRTTLVEIMFSLIESGSNKNAGVLPQD